MVVAELTLPAQPDQVWRHLREPALISRWFGWEYDGLGHEIDVIFLQEARVDDRAEAGLAAMTLTSFGGTPDEDAWRAWWAEQAAR